MSHNEAQFDQDEQAEHLTTPVDFHTADDEEEKLREEFGDPDEEGLYGAALSAWETNGGA